jgi:hypothetical protein
VSLADNTCNNGHGLLIPQTLSASTVQTRHVLMTALSSGVVLIGVSPEVLAPKGKQTVFVVHALTASCTVDTSFGADGEARIALPLSSGGGFSNVTGWAPDGSGVVLVGSTSSAGFAMRIEANGTVDRSFGTDGVATLITPHPSSAGAAADAVAVSPSGEILVGADDGAAACCASEYVAELEPNGGLVPEFGSGGWTPAFATGARLSQLAVQPDGSVLVVLSYIETGEGTVTVDEVTPQGVVDSGFSSAFAAAMASADPGSFFDATLYERDAGAFGLVGTGSSAGAGEEPMYELAAGFIGDGARDLSFGSSGTTRIAGVDGDNVAALETTNGDTVFIDEPWIAPATPTYSATGTLRLLFLTSQGDPDTELSPGGVAMIPAQALEASDIDGFVSFDAAATTVGADVLITALSANGISVVGLRG